MRYAYSQRLQIGQVVKVAGVNVDEGIVGNVPATNKTQREARQNDNKVRTCIISASSKRGEDRVEAAL